MARLKNFVPRMRVNCAPYEGQFDVFAPALVLNYPV